MKKGFRCWLAAAAAAAAAILLSTAAAAVCEEHRMDGGVVTVEPTCTTIGIITYTCENEGCGYSYTEKIGNLGHRYVNGVCAVCGAVEEGYQAGAPTAVAPVGSDKETSPEPEMEPATEAAAPETEPAAKTEPATEPEAESAMELPKEPVMEETLSVNPVTPQSGSEKTPVLMASSSPQTGDAEPLTLLILALTLLSGAGAVVLGRRLARR